MIMSESLTFTVTDTYNGVKASRYLRSVCKLSSRTLSVLKRTDGGLTVNGRLLRTIDILHKGDIVTITLPDEETAIYPVEGNLDILFEDRYLLIVNKPAGMPVHPVKKHQQDTLANIIAYRYKDDSFTFRAVNRLDADTSGIVIIARNRHIASLMQSTNIIKHYTAVCHGYTDESGTVDLPISLAQNSKIVRTVSVDGQKAVTHYKSVNFLNNATVLDLLLETGRTHQIRCHMSHLGHPLFGDDLYGGKRDLISRQALHCESVSFVHPITGESLNVTSELPDDIKKLVKLLSLEDI